MEPATLLRANYLDIIFDQRNKRYGGYELRKNYNRRVVKAVAFLLLGLGALASFSFINVHQPDKLSSRPVSIAPTIIDITPPAPLPKIVVPPKPSAPPPHIRTSAFTDPVVTADNQVKPQQRIITSGAQPGPANTDGDSASTSIIPATHVPATIGGANQPAATSKPLVWVEQMPQFIGDRDSYLNAHLRYPESARAANIDGRVIIGFVVNEDGAVSDAKVVSGIGGGCDEEALKVVNGMPKWKPGKQNGIAVKVFFTLPIKFVLN